MQSRLQQLALTMASRLMDVKNSHFQIMHCLLNAGVATQPRDCAIHSLNDEEAGNSKMVSVCHLGTFGQKAATSQHTTQAKQKA